MNLSIRLRHLGITRHSRMGRQYFRAVGHDSGPRLSGIPLGAKVAKGADGM